MDTHRILVVDDEEPIRHVLQTHLERNGCEVRTAESAETAGGLVGDWEPDVALIDIILPGQNGLHLTNELKQKYPDAEVLVMTSAACAETALKAVRQGAFDYLEKPFHLTDVMGAVTRAIDKRQLELKNRALLDRQEQRALELSSAIPLPSTEKGTLPDDPLAELLQEFISIVTRELKVERASLMLIDESTGELQIAASHGIDEVDPGAVRVPSGKGVASFVAETGEPFLVQDAAEDQRLHGPTYPHLSGSFISAPIALAVPIQSRQKVFGVVNVTNRSSGEPLDARDVAYLRGLATQLATAIEGARRSEQLRRAYQSLKDTQDQLVFSERIQTIGQMAAGVVHDFNNALSVILARAQFVARQLDGPGPDLDRVRADLQTIIWTAMHGAETIKRIQDYTRIREDAPPSPVRLNEVVCDALELSRPKWQSELKSRGVLIDVDLDLGEVPPVCGNVHELTQVVNNLVFNAVDAMPEGGKLTFRSRESDGSVVLTVEDTGTGMDADTRDRIFEPFYSTKRDGQGLGTSIIYGIVTRHGGDIAVESEPGRGTRFTITLPALASECELPDEAESVVDSSDERGARVLLVDDDEIVRETYEEALRLGGHEVVSCSSGSDALARCGLHAFDLIITDLSMSGMSGLELAASVKRLDPGLPIVLFSGWALEKDEEQVKEAGIDHVLVKPCLVEELLDTVQAVARETPRD